MPDGLTAPDMRRLLVTTDAVGGVWRYAVDLAAGLTDRGIETVLAVLGPPATTAQRREAEAVPNLHLVQTGLPLDWTATSPADLAQASSKLASLAALTGATAAHLHAPALVGARPWPVPVVVVAHSCVGTWWRAVRGGDMPDDFRWRTDATAAGLHLASAVIAPTAAHAALLQDVYGPVAAQVVHNGRDPTPVPAGPRDRAVLTAGRLWDEGKGVARLDGAAASLGAPVRAAGPVQGPNGATAAFTHLDLLGTLGPAAMSTAYAAATVFASTARYEPFGLAVLEAAQSGMALVLSDLPGFRELWDGAALFVADGRLPAALRRALDDPAPLAAAARQRATRYTLDAMTNDTLAVHRAAASHDRGTIRAGPHGARITPSARRRAPGRHANLRLRTARPSNVAAPAAARASCCRYRSTSRTPWPRAGTTAMPTSSAASCGTWPPAATTSAPTNPPAPGAARTSWPMPAPTAWLPSRLPTPTCPPPNTAPPPTSPSLWTAPTW